MAASINPSSPPRSPQSPPTKKKFAPPLPDPFGFIPKEIKLFCTDIQFPTDKKPMLTETEGSAILALQKNGVPFHLVDDNTVIPYKQLAPPGPIGKRADARFIFEIDTHKRLGTSNITPFQFKTVWGDSTNETSWDELVRKITLHVIGVPTEERMAVLSELLRGANLRGVFKTMTETMAKAAVSNAVHHWFKHWFVMTEPNPEIRQIWQKSITPQFVKLYAENEWDVALASQNMKEELEWVAMDVKGTGFYIIPVMHDLHAFVLVFYKSNMALMKFDSLLIFNPHRISGGLTKINLEMLKGCADFARMMGYDPDTSLVSGAQTDEGHCTAACVSFMKDLIRVFHLDNSRCRAALRQMIQDNIYQFVPTGSEQNVVATFELIALLHF